jgi:hypothetical protein
MMSATPIMDTPMDFIKLINLITPENKIPVDSQDFLGKFPTNDQMEFKDESKDNLQEYFKGKISFLDRRYDPRLFVQPVFHDAHVKLRLDDEHNIKIKCDEELKESFNACQKQQISDIKKCAKYESDEPDDGKYEEEITQVKKDMDESVKNARSGTKMTVKKTFQDKIKTLKQKIKSNKDAHAKKLKEYNKCLYSADKGGEKCQKESKKQHKRCIKDGKDLPKTPLDNLSEKCGISENEFS